MLDRRQLRESTSSYIARTQSIESIGEVAQSKNQKSATTKVAQLACVNVGTSRCGSISALKEG